MTDTCKARLEADNQYHCVKCGTTWDRDDRDPPACRSVSVGREALDRIRQTLGVSQ